MTDEMRSDQRNSDIKNELARITVYLAFISAAIAAISCLLFGLVIL